MTNSIIEDKLFSNIDFTLEKLEGEKFDNCEFKDCNFSNYNLSFLDFIECRFESCNMSMVKLKGSSVKEVKFVSCKLIGVDFGVCNEFLLSMSFDKCILDYAQFYKLKLQKINIKDCSLKEANLTESDLSGANFLNCDLDRAIFSHTRLNSADFRTAFNYSIDPESNNIKKAKFSFNGISGLLDKYEIVIS